MQRTEINELNLLIREGNISDVKGFLKRDKIELSNHGKDLLQPLTVAMSIGNIDICNLLLDYAPALINSTEVITNFTPLHLAVMDSNLEMVLILLSRGANVNALSTSRTIPLHHGPRFGQNSYEIVKVLLKYGSKINVQDEDGNTPFDNAIYRGLTKISDLIN